MHIPTGNWVVVKRRVRDISSGGEIVKYLIPERMARILARGYSINNPNYHFWAMHINEYNNTFKGSK